MYHGHEGVRELWSDAKRIFGDFRNVPEELFEVDDRVLIFVHITGVGRESGVAVEARIAHVMTFRGDRVILVQSFEDRDEARRAAGLDLSPHTAARVDLRVGRVGNGGPTTSARMPFGVLIDRNGDRVLLGLSGEFSMDAGNRFEEAVAEIAREPVADLIVDLSGITFMDSGSAFLLYELYKRFSGRRP